MGMVPPDRPLTSLPFLDNELIPIVPAGHPLLEQEVVAPQDFLNSQLLTRETGSGSRLALEVYCQQHRLKMEPTIELGSNDAVKHAVLAGLGVAVMPKLSVLSELALGSLQALNITGFPLRRSWCVVYPRPGTRRRPCRRSSTTSSKTSPSLRDCFGAWGLSFGPSLLSMVVGCVWGPFPKTATSTSVCASLRPSMASEIFGKGPQTLPSGHRSNSLLNGERTGASRMHSVCN